MDTHAKTIQQLRLLIQLTQTEAQLAQVRMGQARTDAVRRELGQNAKNADSRTQALQNALRDLGGVPDVVTPAIGRVTSVFKSAVEQADPLDEALLQDLALEHQILDRARYLKVLAETGKQTKIGKLADKLMTAHTATIEWLTTVLAEDALGGPAALQATPLQRVAGGASRIVNLPGRLAVEQVNKTVNNVQHTVQQTGEQTWSKVSAAGDKATQVTSAVREVLTAGRNASLKRAEKVAKRDGDKETAETVHDTRRDLGVLDSSELPIKDYDSLNTQEAIAAVKKLTEAEDIRAILRYEEANRGRNSIVSAAQTQIAAIAKQLVGISS